MEILAYIRDLLVQNDCVIIPGFGGFVSIYHPAEIQASRFYPPTKVVCFNRKLNFNDGLLIGWLSRKEGVSYRDASAKIGQLVAEINYRLTEGEAIDFPGIGVVEYDGNENLTFTPQVSRNINPDSFGLFAFSHDKFLNQSFVEKALHGTQVSPVFRNKKLRKVLVGIPLLALLYMTPMTNQERFQKSDIGTFHEFSGSGISNILTVPEISIQLSESEIIGIDIKESSIPNPVLPVVKMPEQKQSFHLIVGSFKNKSGAEKQVDILESKGYSPKLLSVNGLNYVAAGSYSTYELASAGLRKYNSSDPYSGAWIYKNK